MNVLVDSDILIEVSRGRDAGIIAMWTERSESSDGILYSPVSAAALWSGVRPGATVALARLVAALECAPVDSATGRKAGEYLKVFRKSHSLELGDALIAATSSLRGASFRTRHREHYPMSYLLLC